MRTYGEFCPIARASELIAERWTPIIIRNLLCLVDIHLTRTSYARAARSGRLALDDPPGLAHDFFTWLRPSPFAPFAADGQPAARRRRPARTISSPSSSSRAPS